MLSVACSCRMAVSVWCEWAAKSAFWFSADPISLTIIFMQFLWKYTKSRPIKQGHPGGPFVTKQLCKVGLDVRQLGQWNPNESNTFHDHRHLDYIWIHLSYIDLKTASVDPIRICSQIVRWIDNWNSWASLGRLLFSLKIYLEKCLKMQNGAHSRFQHAHRPIDDSRLPV